MTRPSQRAYGRSKQALLWARHAKKEADRLVGSTTEYYWRTQVLKAMRQAWDWHRMGRELQREEVRG